MTIFGHCHNVLYNKYMLFASWEVRIAKNCDRGLENAAGRGQLFQDRGHSFSLYGPTLVLKNASLLEKVKSAS